MAELVGIYDDRLMQLLKGCPVKIRRASHVEPVYTPDGSVKWQADMAPVGGPILAPFDTRQEALDAEKIWLKEHIIKPDTDVDI